MVEKISELDDALAETSTWTDPEHRIVGSRRLRAALRKGTIAFKAHPLYLRIGLSSTWA